ncbi:MAG: hypothetical protein O6761_07760 [Thaumarchaeota archaeon]|nr:hypothetical protein [Nitrososphaerota archaeon]
MVDAGEITTVLRTRILSHPNTTVETDLLEHLLLTEKITHNISFKNLAQQTTIRVLEKIDGTLYENIDSGGAIFPDDFGDATGVTIVLDGAGADMKITLESAIAEGSAKEIKLTARDELRL